MCCTEAPAFGLRPAGVLTKPIKGAQQGGVEGFFKGVAQGAVGLVVKPFVGVADGIASTSRGIASTTDVSSSHGVFAQRERWPRVLGFGGQLLPYNAEDGALSRSNPSHRVSAPPFGLKLLPSPAVPQLQFSRRSRR